MLRLASLRIGGLALLTVSAACSDDKGVTATSLTGLSGLTNNSLPGGDDGDDGDDGGDATASDPTAGDTSGPTGGPTSDPATGDPATGDPATGEPLTTTDPDTTNATGGCTPGAFGCPCDGDACDDGLACMEGLCAPQRASCGDGSVDPGEACDDGNQSNSDACLASCQPNTCGDGYLHEGVEGCDDGNLEDGDDCSAVCAPAGCGNGVVEGAEDCDDGDLDDTDACLSTCKDAKCGDGKKHAGVEACDDGNQTNTDACVACAAAKCGDGYVRAGVEACDDGNLQNGDGCSSQCKLEQGDCGTDCWGDAGCLTDEGRCIRFACVSAEEAATACNSCFGWQPITRGAWLNQGYCGDIAGKYHEVNGTDPLCGGAEPMCCEDPNNCGTGDLAWHFADAGTTYYLGPPLSSLDVSDCTYWNDIEPDPGYMRITACEK